MKLKFYSLILLASASLCAIAQGYKPTLITPPAGMKTTTMNAKIGTQDYNGVVSTGYYSLTVGNANGHVYVKGMCPDFPDAWLIGTANEKKTIITFEQGQYVGQDFGLDIYMAANSGSDAKRCNLELRRNTTTGAFASIEGYKYCTYYYDDLSTSSNKYIPWTHFTGISISAPLDWEPAAPIAGPDVPEEKHEPVVVPEGLVFYPYTLSGNNIRTGHATHPARLAFDGDDVYMADFCNVAIQTGTCVKGTRKNGQLIFPQEQYIVRFNGSFDMYLYGATYYLGDTDIYLDNLTFNYDATTDTYTGVNGILISTGKFSSTGDFSEYLQNVTLKGTGASGVMQSTTTEQPAATYTLDGRPAHALQRGIYLQGGKKVVR